MPKCIVCNKDMTAAVKDESSWDCPSGGVILDGGSNFGSELYDSLMDGIGMRCIICDDCIVEKLRSGDDYIREIKGLPTFSDKAFDGGLD